METNYTKYKIGVEQTNKEALSCRRYLISGCHTWGHVRFDPSFLLYAFPRGGMSSDDVADRG